MPQKDTIHPSSGRRIKLRAASDQLPTEDSGAQLFKRFSLRLRNLHYSVNRALAERIVELERENSGLRSRLKGIRLVLKHQNEWISESLNPDEIAQLIGQKESPPETVRSELDSARSQLTQLGHWLRLALNE